MEAGSKKTILTNLLVAVTVFCVLLALSFFIQIRSQESRFRKDRDRQIKETKQLKGQLDSMENELTTKDGAIVLLKSEKKSIADKFEAIRRWRNKVEKKNKSLREELNNVKNAPLDSILRYALVKEENFQIKQLIEGVLQKIQLIKSGKNVILDPIIVTAQQTGRGSFSGISRESASSQSEDAGKIVAVDRRNNLVVINLGTKDNVMEGQRYRIFNKGEEIGSAEIIRARYKVSAAVVDSIYQKHTIADIAEGNQISLE